MFKATAHPGSTESRDIDAGELFRADKRHLLVGALPAADRRFIAWSFILVQAIALFAFVHPSGLRTLLGLCLAAGAAWLLVAIKPFSAASAQA